MLPNWIAVGIKPKSATLCDRCVKFALDAAAYKETGRFPEIDNGIDIRRLFLYTTGEFFFLAPVLFRW